LEVDAKLLKSILDNASQIKRGKAYNGMKEEI
jgi:hypothetical protein